MILIKCLYQKGIVCSRFTQNMHTKEDFGGCIFYTRKNWGMGIAFDFGDAFGYNIQIHFGEKIHSYLFIYSWTWDEANVSMNERTRSIGHGHLIVAKWSSFCKTGRLLLTTLRISLLTPSEITSMGSNQNPRKTHHPKYRPYTTKTLSPPTIFELDFLNFASRFINMLPE